MEIEVKYRVPDEAAFKRLDEAVRLGSFQVSPGRLIDLHDRYLDTGDFRVLAAGYFCRRRESREGVVMTFKALEGGDGTVHRREEVSVELPSDVPPAAWPHGAARDLALRLADDRPLETLFELRQQRLERTVARGGRTVAELALDRVTVNTRRGNDAYLECEIELRPGGTEADLRELMGIMRERWHLEPVSESKFARGLALATGVPLDRAQDWQHELRRLRVQQWVARTRGQTAAPEREPAEMPAAEGTPTISVLPTLDRRGDADVETSLAGTEPAEAEPAEAEPAEAEPAETGSGMREVFARARSEAEAAPSGEAVVEVVAAASGGERPQTGPTEPGAVGEDVGMVVADEEAEAIAEMTREEPVDEEAEAEMVEPGTDEEAAVGEEGEAQSEALEAEAEGYVEAAQIQPEAAVDIGSTEPEAAGPRKKERRAGIVSDDTMAEAARKTLLFHFDRMLKHEPGTREGEDPEELHDMRVATRRMRAALRVFDGYLDRDALKPYEKALRRTGRTLGTVRDLDVFYEKTRRYLEGLPHGHESDLDPLLDAWKARRGEARAVMLDYLDARAHQRFTERFGEFLQKPGAGATEPFTADGEPVPRLVRDALPVVLYERLAQVRAFAEWLDGSDVPLTRYHRLRIASKGLRYTLEFFEEVLGPETRPLIEHAKALQDHLGDLQDAVVGCGVAGTFLTWGTWQVPDRPDRAAVHPVLNAPGVATYLAHRQEEIAALIETFPPVWEKVRGQEFARDVAGLVAAL